MSGIRGRNRVKRSLGRMGATGKDTDMERILITSAIPYINGIKHLGNLVGSQLPADLYARYMRARGHEVLFLCATDEHGTPAELAAEDCNVQSPSGGNCLRGWWAPWPRRTGRGSATACACPAVSCQLRCDECGVRQLIQL